MVSTHDRIFKPNLKSKELKGIPDEKDSKGISPNMINLFFKILVIKHLSFSKMELGLNKCSNKPVPWSSRPLPGALHSLRSRPLSPPPRPDWLDWMFYSSQVSLGQRHVAAATIRCSYNDTLQLQRRSFGIVPCSQKKRVVTTVTAVAVKLLISWGL